MHPTLFKIGDFGVPAFGAAILVAFLLGLWVARRRAPRYGVTPDAISDLSTWLIIAGILGARLLYIVQDWKHFQTHPQELYTLRFQGLTSFGGLLGGLLAAKIWTSRRGIPLLTILDILAPSFVLGSGIGRLGCLLNGCCHGRVCPPNAWYGFQQAASGNWYAAAQLVDLALNVVGFLLLLAWAKRPRPRGVLSGLALIVFGASRFVYEFFRMGTVEEVRRGVASSTQIPGLPLTEAHVMALLIVIAGIALVFASRRQPVDNAAPDAEPARA